MIEYVTKNEETDELELKPISYGIPQDPIKERFFLDYSKSEIITGNDNWTVPADGWVNIRLNTSGNVSGDRAIAINGYDVFRVYFSAGVQATDHYAGPVHKGDIITVTSYNTQFTVISFTPYD